MSHLRFTTKQEARRGHILKETNILATFWATRVCYLVHERGVGHEHPQVNVDGRHHAALQLVLPELHRVHVVELQH